LKLDRRSSDGRRKTRNPIYAWYQLNKKKLPLYLFILLTGILIAALSGFKDVVYRSLYHLNITYSSKPTETEDVFANKNTKESRRLLERNLLGSELRQQNANV